MRCTIVLGLLGLAACSSERYSSLEELERTKPLVAQQIRQEQMEAQQRASSGPNPGLLMLGTQLLNPPAGEPVAPVGPPLPTYCRGQVWRNGVVTMAC